MQPPSLSTYQQAAQDIYEPQKTAEAASIKTNEQNTVNELEAGKGQIQTNYQTAIDSLNQTLQTNIGKINQLYTERLGGNFSGLQGNDVGGMLAAGTKQLTSIESTRANALNEIAIKEAGVKSTADTDLSNLTGKYQSLEAKYSQDTYNSASKQYSTDQYRQAQLGLSQQRLQLQEQKAAATSSGVKVKQGSQGQYMFTDKNGEPISMSQFIRSSNGSGQDIINFLKNGTDYDKNILSKLQKSNPQNDQQLIDTLKKLDAKNYYGFQES